METTEIHEVRCVNSRVFACIVLCLSSCGAAADELSLLGGKQAISERYQIFTALLYVYVSPAEDTVLGLCGENVSMHCLPAAVIRMWKDTHKRYSEFL